MNRAAARLIKVWPYQYLFVMQRQAPPQFSPDGLFWWDGARWVPRALLPSVPAPGPVYQASPPVAWANARAAPPWYAKPSPGLRVVLIVFLGLETLIAGLFAVVFTFAALSGGQGLLSYGLGAFVWLTFVVSGVALAGVLVGASWSRSMAFASGVLMSWWIVGAFVGIPVMVCAARLELASYQAGGAGQH